MLETGNFDIEDSDAFTWAFEAFRDSKSLGADPEEKLADLITSNYLSQKPMHKLKQQIRDCVDKVTEVHEKIARLGLAKIRKSGLNQGTMIQLQHLKSCELAQVAQEAEKLERKFKTRL